MEKWDVLKNKLTAKTQMSNASSVNGVYQLGVYDAYSEILQMMQKIETTEKDKVAKGEMGKGDAREGDTGKVNAREGAVSANGCQPEARKCGTLRCDICTTGIKKEKEKEYRNGWGN
jgi:hypothetical protein